jgi:ADP-dependent NAD(P)H-hydrate dehydratase / NAD(P)H-hydrate epimerase
MEALPDWCEPLYDAPRMRAIDSWAIERQGVPSLELMERAGEGVARLVERLVPDGPVAVLCGKGNNGGDGLVAARLLRQAARAVSVICLGGAEELSPDARANWDRLPGEAPVVVPADGNARDLLTGEEADDVFGRAAAVVDAVLGTGFAGSPRGVAAAAIEAINSSPGRIVSVDVPSGVDASTGVVAGAAVRADATATFHAAKLGLWVHPGKSHAGEVVTIDIGIPRGGWAGSEFAQAGLIDLRVLRMLPSRQAGSTKFTSGHVVVVGGSAGMIGAPAMAALAAMRAGAGYVTACVPGSERHVLDAQLMEVMTRPLPDREGALTPSALEPALDALGRSRSPASAGGGSPARERGLGRSGSPALGRASSRAGSLALGPGFGRDPGSAELARELARRSSLPTVIDADGLNAHGGRLSDLADREAATVLTPHAGELARLLEIDAEQVRRERLRCVRETAERSGAVVVLKGDDTLVAEPGGRMLVSRGGSPGLATAGSGDVLTGVIAALLAQGLDALAAAAAGVCLHAQAGREAARAQGAAEGVIASDVIAALPRARQA